MKEVISAEEAAKIIQCNSMTMKYNIKNKIWKFGICIPKEQTNTKKDKYMIYRRKMYAYFGIPIDVPGEPKFPQST